VFDVEYHEVKAEFGADLRDRRVTLEVVDLLGRRVATLIDGQTVTAGRHARTWSPSRHGLSSGLYLLRLRAGGATRTQRLTVVR
jgi:hypothetical protein